MHIQNSAFSKNSPSNDYILETEYAGMQSEQEKISHELEEIHQQIWQICDRQQKDHITTIKNRKAIHSLQKHNKAMTKSLNACAKEILLLSKKIEKIQKQTKKEQATIKKMSDTLKQLKHIITCMNFQAGISSISDKLNNISRKWDKITMRKNKYLDRDIIDADFEEVK